MSHSYLCYRICDALLFMLPHSWRTLMLPYSVLFMTHSHASVSGILALPVLAKIMDFFLRQRRLFEQRLLVWNGYCLLPTKTAPRQRRSSPIAKGSFFQRADRWLEIILCSHIQPHSPSLWVTKVHMKAQRITPTTSVGEYAKWVTKINMKVHKITLATAAGRYAKMRNENKHEGTQNYTCPVCGMIHKNA